MALPFFIPFHYLYQYYQWTWENPAYFFCYCNQLVYKNIFPDFPCTTLWNSGILSRLFNQPDYYDTFWRLLLTALYFFSYRKFLFYPLLLPASSRRPVKKALSGPAHPKSRNFSTPASGNLLPYYLPWLPVCIGTGKMYWPERFLLKNTNFLLPFSPISILLPPYFFVYFAQ